MALKEYIYNGLRFQFEEKDAPKGAVPVEVQKPAKRRTAAANKSRKPRANKAAQ